MSTEVAPIEPQDVDLGEMLAMLTEAARASDEPILLAAGTFAAYPTKEGGLHLVMTVAEGPFAQEAPHRANLPGNLLRALVQFAGGKKGSAVKALFRRG